MPHLREASEQWAGTLRGLLRSVLDESKRQDAKIPDTSAMSMCA